MPLPRTERLRITQQVYREWQEIYGDRDDSEAEAANYDMLIKALELAEREWALKENQSPST
jgi:NAD-dependent DNA ligase